MRSVGTSTVRTPAGEEWRVGRLWLNRSMPRWRKLRMGKVGADDAAEAAFLPDIGGLEELGLAILIGIAVVVLAIVVIPLLLFGIELIVLALVVAAGITGRTLLGRPWVVQAVRGDDSSDALTWRVVGWRRSARVINEVAASLQAGLDPAPTEANAQPLAYSSVVE